MRTSEKGCGSCLDVYKRQILFDLTDRYLQKLSDDLLAWVDNEEKDTSLPRLLRYTFSVSYTHLRLPNAPRLSSG